MAQSRGVAAEPGQGVVGRPPGQLHDYPVEVRWEVTRRHPYYLTLWEEARKLHRHEPVDHPARMLLRQAAALVLGSIGVAGEPVDPGTDFAHLQGEGADPRLLTGSVQPVSYRMLAIHLLRGLSQEDREALARCLVAAGDDNHAVRDPGAPPGTQEKLALLELSSLPSAGLDSCPDVPLFFVHLGASQNSIVRDISDQVRLLKARRNLGSSKVQTSNLGDYLAAWDLREGWTGARYDLAAERTFSEVTTQLGLPSISTTSYRYRAAFEMITGHPFSPELWWRIFAPLKYSGLLGDPAAIFSAPIRRHLRSPSPRPVPDSRVSPQTDSPHSMGVVEDGSAIGDDLGTTELWMDLKELIDRGLGDAEIASRLELGDAGLIAAVRARIADFGLI